MLQGQMEVAKQSFLTMMSHDVRTPLSTILGFSELLYHNRTKLSDEEQNDFLEHIIKNANQLSRYTQIVLDIMFLEANVQSFTVQPVALNEFIKQWMQDALHRFPASQLVFNNGVAQEGPPANTAPAALHKIMYILAEFAIGENPSDESINIQLNYEEDLAHILIHHRAPNLTASDAAVLFRLLHPRDLSESAG
jgi:K+-sensing histidine kinase KdpD